MFSACSPQGAAPGTTTPAGKDAASGAAGTGATGGAGGGGNGGSAGNAGTSGGTTSAPATGGGSGYADSAPAAPDVLETGGPVSTPGNWGNGQWSKRAAVTITDTASTEDLTDFQVPVTLGATSIDYAAARSTGDDLRFVAADGTVLAHQIDSWNPGGTSLIWLRLPRLTKAATTVTVYYGNANAPAPDEASQKSVFGDPYAGVWHLSGDARDASPSGFDGVMMVGGTYAEAKFGKGVTFNGANREHIRLKPNIKILGGAAGCTFSAWIRPVRPENSVNGMIIMTLGKWFNNNHNSYADFNVNANGQMISHIDPGTNTSGSGYARILSDPGVVKADEWSHVTYVIDLAKDEERFFKNGILVSTKKPPAGKFAAPAFIDMVSTRVVIGAEEDVVSHWWTGSMDELRMERTLRSPAWIAAQYRAMTAPGFVTVTRE